MVDDAQWLPPGSGATWLIALVDALPANGHVLLASCSSPAVPLARLATQGAVLGVSEDDLRFTDDELAEFAAGRALPPGGSTTPAGGRRWPSWPPASGTTWPVTTCGKTSSSRWDPSGATCSPW